MGPYTLTPQMRRVILHLFRHGGTRQDRLPFHTLKALERRGVAYGEMARSGAYWFLNQGGRTLGQLLTELAETDPP